MDTTGSTTLHIRTARAAPTQQAQDAAMAAALEAICFPPEQAASPTTIAERMAHYADHFWLIEDEDGTLLALCESISPMFLSAVDRFVDIVGMFD